VTRVLKGKIVSAVAHVQITGCGKAHEKWTESHGGVIQSFRVLNEGKTTRLRDGGEREKGRSPKRTVSTLGGKKT